MATRALWEGLRPARWHDFAHKTETRAQPMWQVQGTDLVSSLPYIPRDARAACAADTMCSSGAIQTAATEGIERCRSSIARSGARARCLTARGERIRLGSIIRRPGVGLQLVCGRRVVDMTSRAAGQSGGRPDGRTEATTDDDDVHDDGHDDGRRTRRRRRRQRTTITGPRTPPTAP